MDMKKNNRFLHSIIFINILIIVLTILFIVLISLYNNKDYYSKNINKIVEIIAYNSEDEKSYGTGWFIDNETIVTNFHVLSYQKSGEKISYDLFEIRFYDEEKYEKVEMFKFDEKNDIAFLKYKGNHIHSYFNYQMDYKTTEQCFCIGNFLNYGLSYKSGYISLEAVNLSYNSQSANYIQCLLNIGQGDSGAPLFNKKNEIIGMITFRTKGPSGTTEQGFAYAIPIERIIMSFNEL
jgi:S1-C subfamily serine protease